jgi:hypothetical protein
VGERQRDIAIRWLAIGSIVGQVVWVLAIAIGGAVEPGYSAYRDAISMLGALDAARPWLFDTAVAVWGLSFIAAAAALWLDAPASLRGRLGPALIGLTGLTQILDGYPFPLDCRRTIDAGCRAREVAGELSWQHYAHGYAFLVGVTALLVSVFAMAWRFRGEPRWGRADLLALAAGIIGLAVVAALLLVGDHEPGGNYGLVQRLSLSAGGVYVLALCAGLLAIRRERGRTASVPAAVHGPR